MKAAYLRIANITHSRWAKDLFEDITIQVNGGQVVWIVGPNGCWKSTILHILAWVIEPDKWNREVKWDIWVVTQGMDVQEKKTIGEYLMDDTTKEDREAMIALWRAWGDELLLTSKLHILSWWQRTKVRLAKCLIDEVDILLLDEPTNHLDYQSIQSLEWLIRRWHGPVVVVSHDRAFLDAICTHIVDIRYGWVETYTWNYTAYIQSRETRIQKQLQDFKLQERKRKAMEAWLHIIRERASFYASPKRWKLLKSREKLYARTFGDQIQKPTYRKHMKMSIGWTVHDKKTIVTIQEWAIGHRSKVLYEIDTTKVVGQDRILIRGANGSGKSTFLNFLLRSYDDKSLTHRIQWWKDIRVWRMSQHDLQQYDEFSVMQRCTIQFPKDRDQWVITTKLINAWVSKEDMIKKMKQLSYWQRVKIRFIQLMSHSYECLILDEPTNHLDTDTRESLESMLTNYEWTLIIVSHDKWFVEKIALNREWKIHDWMMVEV